MKKQEVGLTQSNENCVFLCGGVYLYVMNLEPPGKTY